MVLSRVSQNERRNRPAGEKTRSTRRSSSSFSSCFLSTTTFLLFLFVSVLSSFLLDTADAFVYANNTTYDSLPALFGRPIPETRFYQVRLQYLYENPYLCEVDAKTRDQFVVPPPNNNNNMTNSTTNTPLHSNTPIALLVGRGNCSFQQKAIMAASIDPSIEFLIVYNFRHSNDAEEEDQVLVPMFAEGGPTLRLSLVSVSHSTGQALKAWLAAATLQSDDTTTAANGGPWIRIDGAPPAAITQANINSMLFSALGLFFMLTSFAGCIVILAGTYSQLANSTNGADSMMLQTSRRLLTVGEVQQFVVATAAVPNDPQQQQEHTCQQQHPTGGGQQCAVCIDDFEEDDTDITVLPCTHAFHTDCIVPWLTERQSKCPLCKFDVLEHCLLREQQQGGASSGVLSLRDRLLVWQRNYYRWTSIEVEEDDENDDDDDGILVDDDRMERVEIM